MFFEDVVLKLAVLWGWQTCEKPAGLEAGFMFVP